MAFSYRIEPSKRLVIATLSGTVRGSDIASALETIYRDPHWRPGYATLWESTGITELLFEREDLPTLVRLQRDRAERAGDGPEVILVSRKLDRLMAQMYAVMARNSTRTVHVCTTLEEAQRFLDARSE